MKTVQKLLFLCYIIGITAFSCEKKSSVGDFHLGDPFYLNENKTVTLTPVLESQNSADSILSISFKKVLFDSRCSMASCYLCYGGGLARIQVFFSHQRDTATLTLNIHGCVEEFECNDNLYYRVDTLGYRFCFLRLDPYPEDKTPINQKNFSAKLNISRL